MAAAPMDVETLYGLSKKKPFLIAGPCALESEEVAFRVADGVAEVASRLGVTAVFKSSFDKANRTSLDSFRGPGMDKGLELLARIRERTGLPVLTDIHTPDQAAPVGQVADVLQVPAFLCRQTDLLVAASATGKVVNVKKGQFVAPADMKNVTGKLRSAGTERIWLTERGASFGYNNLVVDFRSIPIMQSLDCPVVFDATHSVQLPGGQGTSSGGDRRFVPTLARAAVAAGADGVFLETHPDPDKALCDGPNSWPLDRLADLVQNLLDLWSVPRVD